MLKNNETNMRNATAVAKSKTLSHFNELRAINHEIDALKSVSDALRLAVSEVERSASLLFIARAQNEEKEVQKFYRIALMQSRSLAHLFAERCDYDTAEVNALIERISAHYDV